MAATPNDTPDRVAVETPRGDIRAGTVVDTELEAAAGTGPQRILTVEIDGARLIVPASDTATPHTHE